jgi:hypothetical protein
MGSCTELISVKNRLKEEIAAAEHIGCEQVELEVDDAEYILGVLNDIIQLKQEAGI